MPLYEYQCQNGHRFEVRHGMLEDPVKECPECSTPVRKVIQPVGIMFKGSGFYATDSRASSETSADRSPKATTDAAKSDSTKSESSSTSDTGSSSDTSSSSSASSGSSSTPAPSSDS